MQEKRPNNYPIDFSKKYLIAKQERGTGKKMWERKVQEWLKRNTIGSN